MNSNNKAHALIQRNIEHIEERIVNAISKGCSLPVALIYQVDGPLGEKIAKLAKVEDRLPALLEQKPDGHVLWHLIVGDVLSIGDFIADALDGTFMKTGAIDEIIRIITSEHMSDQFPVISVVNSNDDEQTVAEIFVEVRTLP